MKMAGNTKPLALTLLAAVMMASSPMPGSAQGHDDHDAHTASPPHKPTPLENALVLGNRSVGPLAGLIQLSPVPYAIGAISIVANMSHGATTGVLCKGNGTFLKPIVHSGYNYDGATSASTCPATLKLVTQYP